jgi:Protein of unknown function (DUF1207)
MPRLCSAIVLLVICSYGCRPGEAGGQAAAAKWEFCSDRGRAFAPLLADPREAQVRLGFLQDEDGDSFFELGMGGDLGLLRGRFSETEIFTATVRGLIIARFEVGSDSFDMQNADFIGGLALGYRCQNNSAELLIYHQSSHLGDEVLDDGRRARIDYGRETLRLLGSHQFDSLRIYGGPSLHIQAQPEELQGKVTLQFGAEYDLPPAWGPWYAALDLQCKEENDWVTNFAVQLGLKLGDPAIVVRQQRLFLEYFHGYSNMGQYFDERSSHLMIGLSFAF